MLVPKLFLAGYVLGELLMDICSYCGERVLANRPHKVCEGELAKASERFEDDFAAWLDRSDGRHAAANAALDRELDEKRRAGD